MGRTPRRCDQIRKMVTRMSASQDVMLATFPAQAANPLASALIPFAPAQDVVRSAMQLLGTLATELANAGLHSSALIVQALGNVIQQECAELTLLSDPADFGTDAQA